MLPSPSVSGSLGSVTAPAGSAGVAGSSVPVNSSLLVSPSLSQSAVKYAPLNATVSSPATKSQGSVGSVAASPSGGLSSLPLVTPSPSQSADKYGSACVSVMSAVLNSQGSLGSVPFAVSVASKTPSPSVSTSQALESVSSVTAAVVA